ncbi:MAG: hypothetical protein WKF58_08280 [Ilumatobacteraceae bacterium]
MVVVVAAFAIPELWTMVARSYTSTGDRAIIEQRTREVFSADIPLVGAFSRYGWSHPGPLSFYSYAIPYRLLGQQGKAVLVAALAVNAAGVAVAMWMLARRGLTAFCAGIGLFVALFGGWQPHSLIDPWNPTIAVVAVIVFLVSCWAALCGDRVAPGVRRVRGVVRLSIPCRFCARRRSGVAAHGGGPRSSRHPQPGSGAAAQREGRWGGRGRGLAAVVGG